MIKTIEWKNNRVIMIDQRKLPGQETYVICSDYHQVIKAIKEMVIRGAPAIGVAAAMGVALGAEAINTDSLKSFLSRFDKICEEISRARPTAVNLSWAVERMRDLVENSISSKIGSEVTPAQPYLHVPASAGSLFESSAKPSGSWCHAPKGGAWLINKKIDVLKKALIQEARHMLVEDIAINKRLGSIGQKLIKNKGTVLTHCNAGALATGGYGTALGVVRAAKEAGKQVQVIADETRPFLQGTRLTAWELVKDHIPVTLITDNMAGYLMKKGLIDVVIVGADRIAANGDTANKIGTYSVAILAKEHGVPFYVAAPCSTIDRRIKTGEDIPIEERNEKEVTHLAGKRMAPLGIAVLNPAFDVTPHSYITGIITEKGILKSPYQRNIAKLWQKR